LSWETLESRLTLSTASLPAASVPPRIVFVGDSITDGNTYPLLIKQALTQAGLPTPLLTNAGVAADTSAQMLLRLDWDVLPYQPTLVTISAGINDAYHGVSPAAFEANIKAILDRLAGAHIPSMILTTSFFGPQYDAHNATLDQYNAILRRLAGQYGDPVAEVNGLMQLARAAGSFVADTAVVGGTPYTTSDAISTADISNPAPQAVYQTVRYGNFTYTLPKLTPGASYTVRLHFAEVYWNAAGQRLFDVTINGATVLSNFDILATAGGKDKALVEEFTTVANAQGQITIQFSTIRDNAMVNGIEILPAPAAVNALNAGGGAAGSFGADADFSGGIPYTTSDAISTAGVTNPAPQAVYQTVRYGNFTYTLPKLTPGASYTVRLHFAEVYWNAAGQRLFDVTINDQRVLTNFDIYAAAGGKDKALVQSFTATADAQGRIVNAYTTVKDNALSSGIEVIPAPFTPVPASARINSGGDATSINLLEADDIHPNYEGQRVMARAVLDALGDTDLAVPQRFQVELQPGVISSWQIRVAPGQQPSLDGPSALALQPDQSWTTITVPGPGPADGWWDEQSRREGFVLALGQQVGPGSLYQGVAYLNSASTQQVYFNTGAYLETIWLNGQLVYQNQGWTGWHAGKERLPAQLQAGANKVVIETGDAFFLSVTDTNIW
jgi:lysophospholipase L1-like esterase